MLVLKLAAAVIATAATITLAVTGLTHLWLDCCPHPEAG